MKSVTLQGSRIRGSYVDGSIDFKTLAPPDTELIPILIKHKVDIKVLPEDDNPWYLTALISWLPMVFLIAIFVFFMRQMQAGGGKAMSFGKSRARLISESQNKVTFQDVAGVEEAKEELGEIIEFLRDPKKFTRLGGKIPKGVLLMGAPGTGKTLLAKAVAGEASVPFFSISGSDFVEMFVGVGASRVRDLFIQGKKNAPCIIFIDEIDAVGRHRGAGLGGGHDEREQTLNQLLVEMDGFETNEGVILISATNRPDVLDPALLRPGRFDRQVVVPPPDIRGRTAILGVHTRKTPVAKNVDLETISRGTPGFSGADLANLVNEAALNAARRNRNQIEMKDFEFAKDKVLMGGERRSLVISLEERRNTAFHEAGHTFVARKMPGTDPIHKVTIIPRGRALGVTQQLPLDDRHTYSKDYLISQIAVLMGGRAAEEIFLGHLTTGAGNDIQSCGRSPEREGWHVILGVGVDLVDVHRMERALNCRWGKRFVAKVFSAEEIAACKDSPQPAQGYAARFAAKEALAKALGTGFSRGVSPSRIVVRRGRKTSAVDSPSRPSTEIGRINAGHCNSRIAHPHPANRLCLCCDRKRKLLSAAFRESGHG